MKFQVIFILVLLLAGCSQTQKNAVQPTPQQTQTLVPIDEPSKNPEAQQTKTLDVMISEFKFTPRVIIVDIGDTVLWTNTDTTPHTVTFDSLVVDERLSPNQDITHVFNEAGTFDYHCSLHPEMQGTVVVQ